MILDLTNIPEDFDWRAAYFELNDEHHDALLKLIDLRRAILNWSTMTNDQFRLHAGECSAQEIRTTKAVLNNILSSFAPSNNN